MKNSPEVHKSKATAVRLIKSVYIVTKHRKGNRELSPSIVLHKFVIILLFVVILRCLAPRAEQFRRCLKIWKCCCLVKKRSEARLACHGLVFCHHANGRRKTFPTPPRTYPSYSYNFDAIKKAKKSHASPSEMVCIC